MTANINSAAFNVKENGLPWHKLGTMVQGAMTWQDAMTLSGLDFEVKKFPVFMKNPFGQSPKGWEIPEMYCVYRMDKTDASGCLGKVGSQYVPVQNKYMFDFVDTIIESVGGAHYESAGALGNGEVVWCLAKVPEADFSLGKDKHETYLLFTGSHDGSRSCTAQLTTVRVVCQNTLNTALSQKQFDKIKVKHTANAGRKLDEIKAAWTGVTQTVDNLKTKFSRLTEKKVTAEFFNGTMSRLFGKDWQDSQRKQNIGLEIARIFEANDGAAGFPEQKGTAFNLLNAVTNYVDHSRTARMTSGKPDEAYARAQSSWLASGANLKTEALNTIVEMVELPTELPKIGVDSILSKMAF